ncbi:Uncharacterised protein [Yersinia enterocolitica]|nr:Uncharacterised protein [Yersinia enterocolitica]
MILPTAISSSPFNAPAMNVANSGKLVPMAITVSPMTSSLTPATLAITVALSIIILADSGKIMKASTSHNNATVLLLSCGNSANCSRVKISFPCEWARRAIFSIRTINAAAAKSKITPSPRLRWLSASKKPHNTVTTNIKGNSRRKISERTVSGRIRAAPPTISKRLVILEPNTLPTAISVWLFSAAVTDTISSGSEVPMPTMVIPIMSGGIPKERANTAAP